MPLAVQFNFDPRCGYEYNLNFGLAMDFNGKTRDNYMITYSLSVSCFENILGTKAVYFFAEQWSDSVPKVSPHSTKDSNAWLKPFPLCIAGLTGRKLKLPNDIVNPSDKFRIGVKRAINLYPKPLAERIVKERLEKDWEPSHKLVLAQVMRP